MARLVNLGSLCVDNVYAVPNIVGSAETIASESLNVYPGGKGLNQSLAAAKAGADVVHVGCVGPDGDWLKQVLAEAGVDVTGIREVATRSGHAVIQVNAQGENAIVIAGGANREIIDHDIDRALEGARSDDWLLLQNEINDLPKVLSRAASQGINVAFNIAPVDGRESNYDLSSVKLLIVNEIEAAAVAGLPADTLPETVLDALRGQLPTTDVVLTLGKDGVHYASADATGPRYFVPSFSVDAVDETGAGDTFIGYLMADLLDGVAVPLALRRAAAAGALAVTKAGAASSIPEAKEVEALVATRAEE